MSLDGITKKASEGYGYAIRRTETGEMFSLYHHKGIIPYTYDTWYSSSKGKIFGRVSYPKGFHIFLSHKHAKGYCSIFSVSYCSIFGVSYEIIRVKWRDRLIVGYENVLIDDNVIRFNIAIVRSICHIKKGKKL